MVRYGASIRFEKVLDPLCRKRKVEKAPLLPDEIIKACKQGLLAAVHKKQPNLSFGKNLVDSGVKLLVKAKATE